MIKNLKVSENFKKRIIVGSLGFVLATSTGSLIIGVHNANSINKLTESAANNITTNEIDVNDYLNDYDKKRNDLEEQIAQLENEINTLEAKKQELKSNSEKSYALANLYLVKYQNQGQSEYQIVYLKEKLMNNGLGIDALTMYYEDSNDKEKYAKFLNMLEKYTYNKQIVSTYEEVHGYFNAVSNSTPDIFPSQDYVIFDEISPLGKVLTDYEIKEISYTDQSGIVRVNLFDIDRALERINEKYGNTLKLSR